MRRQRKHGRRAALLADAFAGLLSFAPAVDAQTSDARMRAGNRSSPPAFTLREEKIIREYFAAYPGESEVLPAEIAAPLAKGQRLRTATERRALPRDLVVRLKPLPKGYQRVIVENDALIVSARTGTIVDVILDAR